MKKYIVIMLAGLFLAVINPLHAKEAVQVQEGENKQIEEVLSALDNLTKFGDLLKEDVTVKDAKKYLKEHKEEFIKLKLETLVNLDETKIDKSKKALRKVIKEQLKKAIKLRMAFLKAKSGRTLISKIQQIYQGLPNAHQIQQNFNQYQNMDKEEFNEAKEELIKEPQWSIEFGKEGEVEFNDELTSIKYLVDAEGKSKDDEQNKGRVGAKVAVRAMAAMGGRGGAVSPASLGIAIQDLSDEEKKKLNIEKGVIITNVKEDSKAEEAGLKKDDIIISAEDEEISKKTDFTKVLKEAGQAESIALKIKRGDKTLDIELEVEKQQANQLFQKAIMRPGGQKGKAEPGEEKEETGDDE